MKISTEHLQRCVSTLAQSLKMLNNYQPQSLEYDVLRNAVVKGFELTLETAGKLLKKTLKAYLSNPREADSLVFKQVFRHAHKHGLLTSDEVTRWFSYRDNRNTTAHDYGEGFAEDTLVLLPQFILDVDKLIEVLNNVPD